MPKIIRATLVAYFAMLFGAFAQTASTDAKTTSINTKTTPATATRSIATNGFNPSIGVVLNGQYGNYSLGSPKYSLHQAELHGFALGHEAERPSEGFALTHSEFNFTANADDKFMGSATFAIVEHSGGHAHDHGNEEDHAHGSGAHMHPHEEEGEEEAGHEEHATGGHTHEASGSHGAEIELEEAFIRILPGMGLPTGMTMTIGRAYRTLGYLNEHHAHTDDFNNRPLPYRVFLDGGYNDDGVELSYILPLPFYTEIGGGAYSGNAFPFGGGTGAQSAYLRIGGDIGKNHSWRFGYAQLSGDADERASNDDSVRFTGDVDLQIIDLRYTWAPTGNPRQSEVLFQTEYITREETAKENGYQMKNDSGAYVAHTEIHAGEASGWYAQAVYKFAQNWRIGLRQSTITAPEEKMASATHTHEEHDPIASSLMVDWTNSEFSRVRLQYTVEEPAHDREVTAVTLRYIVSLGAHGAHRY